MRLKKQDVAAKDGIRLDVLQPKSQSQPSQPSLVVQDAAAHDSRTERITSLTSHMLLNKRDSFKDWVKAVVNREVKVTDSNPIVLARVQKDLNTTYEVVLSSVQQLPDTKERINTLSKLSCLNFISEAEVWAQRGLATAAKAQLGKRDAIVQFETAEDYLAKAYYHYIDLREKFSELNNSLEMDMQGELTKIDQAIKMIYPQLYQARLNKHLNHILLSLSDKMDPTQLLFSVVSLCTLFIEYPPPNCPAYDERKPVREYLQMTLEMVMKNTIVSFKDPDVCQRIFDTINDDVFRNLLDTLYFAVSNGVAFVISKPVRDDFFQQCTEFVEAVIEEVGADAIISDKCPLSLDPGKNDLIMKLKQKYQEELIAYHGGNHDDLAASKLNDTQKSLLFQRAKAAHLNKQLQLIIEDYPNRVGEVAYSLWLVLGSLRQSVVDSMKAMAKVHPCLQESLDETGDEDNAQDYLSDHGDYHKLLPASRKAVYNVANAILTRNLWYPDVVTHDENTLNPTEKDIRSTVCDTDVVEELSRNYRSNKFLSQ